MDFRILGTSVIIFMLLFITATGCTYSNANANPPVTTPAPVTSPVPAPEAIAAPTTPAPTVLPVAPASTPTPAVSFKRSEVNQRFMDIAFGNENAFLDRWSDRSIKVSIFGEYTSDDIRTLNDFITRFNNVSATSKLTRVMEGVNEDITIHLAPLSFLNTMHDDETNRIFRDGDTGEIVFIEQTQRNQWEASDTVYINSRFTGEERKYLLLRSLLYELGFEGYSGDPSSFFYYRATSADISNTDWIAIGMMYSKRFHYGDSFSLVKGNLSL